MTVDFSAPETLNWGHFKNAKGADIRYAHAPVDPPGSSRGSVDILGGFKESAEKYFEVAREMNARGLDVWMMDWRGQGGSERYLPDQPQKAHHEGYDEQIATLHQFTQTIVKTDGKPLLAMAHSMGAHLTLRYLKEHEGVFDSAMLTAPMLDISYGVMTKPLARQVVKFAKANNYLDKYVPGGTDWSEIKNLFAGNFKTSDPERFAAALDLQRKNPDLKIGDATYGWVYHTMISLDILSQEDYLKSIKTPILMQSSGDDKIVQTEAQDRACALLPNCKQFVIPEAKHEIWHERDVLRDLWLNRVDEYINERLKPRAPTPKKPQPHSIMRRPGLAA